MCSQLSLDRSFFIYAHAVAMSLEILRLRSPAVIFWCCHFTSKACRCCEILRDSPNLQFVSCFSAFAGYYMRWPCDLEKFGFLKVKVLDVWNLTSLLRKLPGVSLRQHYHRTWRRHQLWCMSWLGLIRPDDLDHLSLVSSITSMNFHSWFTSSGGRCRWNGLVTLILNFDLLLQNVFHLQQSACSIMIVPLNLKFARTKKPFPHITTHFLSQHYVALTCKLGQLFCLDIIFPQLVTGTGQTNRQSNEQTR